VTVSARSPLLGEVARLEQAFAGALTDRRATEAAEAILALDRAILEWSGDTLQTDDPDRARAVLHSLVHRLGETASVGLRDPRELLAPLVEGLIALRAELRAERAWQLADRVRDRLIASGIDLHDTPAGTTWTLRS
jgi:cysteinyl-tRNA synthetase